MSQVGNIIFTGGSIISYTVPSATTTVLGTATSAFNWSSIGSGTFVTGWTTFDIETKTQKLTRENKELEDKVNNLTKDIGSLRRIIES